MSEENKHIIYSSEDIHQYLSGKLTPAQMHAMEKAALSDPLLADAIEGYDQLADFKNEQGFEQVRSDLTALRQRIDSTNVVNINKSPNRWWQVAAAAIILIGAFALYKFNSTKKESEIIIAKNEPKPVITSEQTTTPVFKADSNATNTTTQNGLTTVKENKLFADVSTTTGSTVIKDTANRSYNFTVTNDADLVMQKEEAKHPAAKVSSNEAAERLEYDRENIAKNNITQNFSGRILDDNANAVPYAEIIINNIQESKTDANGMFNINMSDSVAQITAFAKNYRATTTNINSGTYNTITLSPKKIVFKKDKEADKSAKAKDLAKKSKQLHRSIVTVLTKNNAEPRDGWINFEQHLIDLLSGSEYDDGKPVFGEMIFSFDINAGSMPDNFLFEKSINSDVDEAIESLIKNESYWKAVEHKSLPGTVKLKIIF